MSHKMPDHNKNNIEKIAKEYEKNIQTKFQKDIITDDEKKKLRRLFPGLIERLAVSFHDAWAFGKFNGEKEWRYGHTINEIELTHNELLPFEYLADSNQSFDNTNALLTVRELIDTIKINGSLAAAAGIMARNMSHNIGSHVLSYWAQILSNEDEMIKNVIDNNNPYETELLNQLSIRSSNILFDYLKQRQNYIAEILTSSMSWEKAYKFEYIIRPFKAKEKEKDKENVALLDNIAKSEGFCINSKILSTSCQKARERHPKDNCDGCKRLSPNLADDILQPEALEIEIIDPEKMVFSIPNGTVGFHALYSILENFIRNSAKHGGATFHQTIKKNREKNRKNNNKALPEKLIFSVKVVKDSSFQDYIGIRISDNKGNANGKLVNYLNEICKKLDFVYDNGDIISGDWGIKEMILSANFLRKRGVKDLFREHSDKSNALPLIEFSSIASTNDLAVKFYLRKPKEIIIINNKTGLKGNSEAGIDVCTYKELETKLKENITISHRFIIFDNDEKAQQLISDFKGQLPFRIIVESNGTGNDKNKKEVFTDPVYNDSMDDIYKYLKNGSLLQDSDVKEFICKIYDIFINLKGLSSEKITIMNVDNSITKKWGIPGNSNDIIGEDSIIFDSHGAKITEPCIEKVSFYQPLSEAYSFSRFLKTPPGNDFERKIIISELLELACIKILIADERIQNSLQGVVQYGEGKIEKKKTWIFEKMGIFIAPLVNGCLKDDDIEGYRGEDILFLIIHKGVINKSRGEGEGENFLKELETKFPHIIIVSGAGEPKILLKDSSAKYAPVNVIEECINSMDKYSLIQLLFSIRRVKNG